MEYFDRIISLGEDCSVAGSLRNIKYKEFSYPFDWTVTKLNFIINSFNSKFTIFETIFDKCIRSGNGHLKYEDKIYFYHDSKSVNKALKDKYIRRGKRLNDLLNSNKKILFIRKCATDTFANICLLKDIIRFHYPHLNFRILLVNNIKNETNYDNYITHIYKELDCFVSYENDVYSHRNQKLAYDTIYEEVKKFKSIEFEQPKYRDQY